MDEVLDFWFQELTPQQWWQADPVLDAQIRQRFASLLEQAATGHLHTWRASARGRLAEIIVLDQFSRNIFRGQPAAFAQDLQAQALTQEAIDAGALDALAEMERTFLLMPYMHSESAAVHAVAAPLFQAHTPALNYDFERQHQAIILRFGRYPHRNAILGRSSTAEELAFLQQPGSSF